MRHRGSSPEPGLHRHGFRHGVFRQYGTPGETGHSHRYRPRRRQRAGSRRGCGFGRDQREESRGGDGAGGTRARRIPCGDAGRTHAIPARHRGCRHARQDNDHEPDHRDFSACRPGSHLCDRRAAERRRAQRQVRCRALYRRGGGRERCLVPVPAAHCRRRYEYRPGPPFVLPQRLRTSQARLPRLRGPAALLRRGGALRGRRQRAFDDRRLCPAGGDLRAARRCGLPGGERGSRGDALELYGHAAERFGSRHRNTDAGHAQRFQRARCDRDRDGGGRFRRRHRGRP